MELHTPCADLGLLLAKKAHNSLFEIDVQTLCQLEFIHNHNATPHTHVQCFIAGYGPGIIG